MFKIAFLFFSGILACQVLPELPSSVVIIPTIVSITGLAFWRKINAFTVPMVIFLYGFFGAWAHAVFILDHTLDVNLEGKTLLLEGEIIGLPDKDERRLRFDMRVINIEYKGYAVQKIPKKIRLSGYRTNLDISPGDLWRFQVRLKRPHGWRNPGGFDYEGWLFQHRINATGYIVKGKSQRIQASSILSIDKQRQKIAEKIAELLPSQPYKGVIQALLMGDKSQISSAYWKTLVNTGTIHLMAISGLHIGIIFTWFYFIGRWLWVMYGRLALVVPAQKIGVLCGIFGALLYAMLAGFSIPTQRAFIMVCVGASFFLLSRPVNRWSPLLAALFVVLLYDPLAVLSPGFWLSFWAVAIIFSCLQPNKTVEVVVRDRMSRIKKWLMIQVALLVGLSPILFYFFHKVSLIAPLANLLAVPWVGLIIIPLVFIGSLLSWVNDGIAAWLLRCAEWQVGWLSTYLQWLEKSPMALWEISAPPLWSVVLALIGVVLLLFRVSENKTWRYRMLGGLLFIPMVFITPALQVNKNEFKVIVFDIGQGLSIVVQTQKHTLVYDTGPFFSERFNAVDSALLPYLSVVGVTQIDQLIIGHADNDHSGGVDRIERHIPIEYVVGSEIDKFLHIFPEIQYCRAGKKWQWEGIWFEMLSPINDVLMGNNASCVLRIFNNYFSVLLPGDIEKEAEQYLLHVYGNQLKSSVIVAPHHGSLTSSTTPFIEAVNPQAVVFSTGYRNRFGFPKNEVVQRYKRLGVDLYNTAHDGAIIIDSGAADTEPSIDRYRWVKKQYWHGLD